MPIGDDIVGTSASMLHISRQSYENLSAGQKKKPIFYDPLRYFFQTAAIRITSKPCPRPTLPHIVQPAFSSPSSAPRLQYMGLVLRVHGFCTPSTWALY